jgi:hypothetical protein
MSARISQSRPRLAAAAAALFLALLPLIARADGEFHGHARYERVKGDPSKGYVELYEYKAFLTPVGDGTGYCYHLGNPGDALHPYGGCMTWKGVKPGEYSLIAAWGEFYPRGKVIPHITIRDGERTERDAEENLDYAVVCNIDTEKETWDTPGGNPVFQTFVATGTSIVRASLAKADSSKGGDILFSIHEDDGGPVETWPQVGPTRRRGRGGSFGDHWVSWDAGEVPTTPGKSYALRLEATNGVKIQPFWSDDNLYPKGSGFRNEPAEPVEHDYHMFIFSDNDGTVATMLVRSPGFGTLAADEYRERWAQSYTAGGTSLAGTTVMGSLGGSAGWKFSAHCEIHQETPDGPPIGPRKTMPCAFAPFVGIVGVSYNPGEVPTEPGKTYWIVWERVGGGGFNASKMNEGDSYGGGTAAWFDGQWHREEFDLFANILEYTGRNE